MKLLSLRRSNLAANFLAQLLFFMLLHLPNTFQQLLKIIIEPKFMKALNGFQNPITAF